MSRQVDKKNDELPTLLSKVLAIIEIEQVDFALECKINPGTLSKALERRSFSKDIVDKIHDRYAVRKGYWEDGKEPIFDKNGTYVDILSKNRQGVLSSRETFYADLIEGNDEYSLIPRAVLKDYKIVPDTVISVIIESHKDQKREMEKSRLLEIENLNAKNMKIIDEYEKDIKELQSENEALKRENAELRRIIPPQQN